MSITKTFTEFADRYTVTVAETYRLSFLGGNDILTIYAGTVEARMGLGADLVSIRSAGARIWGDEGADRFDIIASSATIDGGADNDLFNIRGGDLLTARGGAGADRFYFLADTNWAAVSGGDGNDLFNGYNHVISGAIRGEAGNDIFQGFANYSWLGLYGGTGNDTYRMDPYSPAFIYENLGDGTDVVQVANGVSFTLGANFENLIVVNFATVSASATLTGNELSNVITGGAAAEVLVGLAGVDRLTGNDGADRLDGGDDNDILSGGTGNDSLAGGNGADRLTGEAGDDSLDGGDGADRLSGDAGNDSLVGGAGNDYLNGGIGNDHMAGGAGNDSYIVDSALDGITEVGFEGTDHADIYTLNYQLAGGVETATIRLTGGTTLGGSGDSNTLTSGLGSDIIYGGFGDDVIIGGAGNDELTGGMDFDQLYGGDGDDVLSGANLGPDLDAGDDYLNGGAGDDILIADWSFDEMIGGTGADRFDFNEYQHASYDPYGTVEIDAIMDFETGLDTIDLSDIDANWDVEGNQAFTFVTAFTGAAGELRVVFNEGVYFVQGSLGGEPGVDFGFYVHSSALVQGDFIL